MDIMQMFPDDETAEKCFVRRSDSPLFSFYITSFEAVDVDFGTLVSKTL